MRQTKALKNSSADAKVAALNETLLKSKKATTNWKVQILFQ